MNEPALMFRAGAAKYRDLVFLMGYWGPPDELQAPTMATVFDEEQIEDDTQGWGLDQHDHVFVDVVSHQDAEWDRPAFCALSHDGIVFLDLDEDTYEEIPCESHGVMNRIASIDGQLYAIGVLGQVYRRDGKGVWTHFDQGLLEASTTKNPLNLSTICGVDGDLFVGDATRGEVHWRNNAKSAWSLLHKQAGQQIQACVADGEKGIWVVGSGGLLMHGNGKGLKAIDLDDDLDFVDACVHDGILWICTETEIYTYSNDTLSQVETGLKPALRNCHRLQSVEGALWSFGLDDVARLENGTWTRFFCPACADLE